ncbi:MAG: hypothetical protein C4527_05870 [Candidatus Omnitrophota bacterium]|jgi:hypothetical protein|nr:MAG: hypothetical protein C4527_05870 [Candidatus Omnitrophota bacterium]
MKRNGLWIAGIIGIAVMGAGFSYADTWTVGEKWTYQHEGAVPWRSPDQQIDGDRIREVVSVQGEGEAKRWLISEIWGNESDRAGSQHVDAQRLYDKMDIPNGESVPFKPALPFDYLNLKAGEKKDYESKVTGPDGMEVPLKYSAERLADETIKVPAGEYKNCVHVKSQESIIFSREGQELTITTNRESWYHPSVNGMVKEIFSTKMPMPDMPESKGTSSLKAYAKKKAE